jgi:chemotaxis protein MotB
MNSARRHDDLVAHHLPPAGADGYRQQARLRTGTVVLLTLVLSAAAAITGYCGWTLWMTQRKLSAAQADLSGVSADHKRVRTDAEQLTQAKLELETQLAAHKARVTDLEAQLTVSSGRLSELEANRSEIDARLAEFRRITQQFQNMIDAGRLEVKFRRGRMIVALPAQVLFPSGSAKLTDEGSKALRDVAAILHGVNDRKFIVAGHTDNVPVSTSEFADNWQLSSTRALRVIEALIGAGMRPSQLVAAGYGEFEPVATNKTPKGRQKNRRIEIALEPYLTRVDGIEIDEPVAAEKPEAPVAAAQHAAGAEVKAAAPAPAPTQPAQN